MKSTESSSMVSLEEASAASGRSELEIIQLALEGRLTLWMSSDDFNKIPENTAATNDRLITKQDAMRKPGTGRHWEEKREVISDAAYDVIDEQRPHPLLSPEIWHPNKSGLYNAAKIAAIIDDQRHRWTGLKEIGPGTSRESIVKTLRNEFKKIQSKLLQPPTD